MKLNQRERRIIRRALLAYANARYSVVREMSQRTSYHPQAEMPTHEEITKATKYAMECDTVRSKFE